MTYNIKPLHIREQSFIRRVAFRKSVLQIDEAHQERTVFLRFQHGGIARFQAFRHAVARPTPPPVRSVRVWLVPVPARTG